MNVCELNIAEIETAPPIELSPEEINELADDLAVHHAQFAERYCRAERAHWGQKYPQRLIVPIECNGSIGAPTSKTKDL